MLLGIVGSDGVVGYVSPRLEVDADFVREARRGRSPERRFRFASRCVEGKCSQWTGSRCGVIDFALREQQEGRAPRLAGSLPRCTIRVTCRWFAQAGPDACGVCPLVVTDGRSEDAWADTSMVADSGPAGLPSLETTRPGSGESDRDALHT